MASDVITDLNQVNESWLTHVLTRNGALSSGTVAGFEAECGSGNWSGNARLTLRYSSDAQGDRPRSLFLKLVNTDTGDGEYFLPAEVTTYTRDYVDVPDAPLLRCYDAAYAPAIHRYHVLLDDMTASHTDARDLAPTLEYGLALAEGFAALHARWWGAPGLAERGAAVHDAAHIQNFVAIAEPGVGHVKALLADELAPHWPTLIEEIFTHLPGLLIERTRDPGGFTLIHGDPNPGNILVPREGVRPIYLIDCQPFDWSLVTWLGAYDLAYAIGLYWEPALRRRLEMPILRHYHERLSRRGVTGYTQEQLLHDYRLSIALCVTVAVEYMRGGSLRWRDFIVGILSCTLTACDDLDSRALWRS